MKGKFGREFGGASAGNCGSRVSTVKSRINACGLICIIGGVAVSLRLFYLQTFRHDELTIKAARAVTSSVREVKSGGKRAALQTLCAV